MASSVDFAYNDATGYVQGALGGVALNTAFPPGKYRGGTVLRLSDGGGVGIAAAYIRGVSGGAPSWNSLGSSSGGSTVTITKAHLSAKLVTAAASVATEIAGGGVWDPEEHDTVSPRTVKLRVVLATSNAAVPVRVRLYNVSAGAYVTPLNGAFNYLETSSTVSVMLTSADLSAATNFNKSVLGVYEVHVQSTDAAGQAVLLSAELVVDGP